MPLHKWQKVFCLWAESQGDGQFQKKPQMEVAEVLPDRIQQEYAPFAPVEKPLLVHSLADEPEEHLADEHRHRVFVEIASDAVQGMSEGKI